MNRINTDNNAMNIFYSFSLFFKVDQWIRTSHSDLSD